MCAVRVDSANQLKRNVTLLFFVASDMKEFCEEKLELEKERVHRYILGLVEKKSDPKKNDEEQEKLEGYVLRVRKFGIISI